MVPESAVNQDCYPVLPDKLKRYIVVEIVASIAKGPRKIRRENVVQTHQNSIRSFS